MSNEKKPKPSIVMSQIEEALEERQGSDRRKADRGLDPTSGVDRRQQDRRKSAQNQ